MWALKKIIFATPDSRPHVCKCPINKEDVHHIQSKREKFKSPSACPSARLITFKMGGEAGHCIISQRHYYTIFLHEKHVGIAEVTKAHLHRDGAFIKSHGIPIGCDRLLVRCCLQNH